MPVVKPAVIKTTQTTILNAAITQVGAAVRDSADPSQAELALIVAEQHEILTHDANRQRRAIRGHFFRQGDRLPIATQQSAAWSAGAGAG